MNEILVEIESLAMEVKSKESKKVLALITKLIIEITKNENPA